MGNLAPRHRAALRAGKPSPPRLDSEHVLRRHPEFGRAPLERRRRLPLRRGRAGAPAAAAREPAGDCAEALQLCREAVCFGEVGVAGAERRDDLLAGDEGAGREVMRYERKCDEGG